MWSVCRHAPTLLCYWGGFHRHLPAPAVFPSSKSPRTTSPTVAEAGNIPVDERYQLGDWINASMQDKRRRTACSSSLPLVYDLKTRLLDALQGGRGHNPRRKPWNGALGRRNSRTFAPTVGQRAYTTVSSEQTAEITLSDVILASLYFLLELPLGKQRGGREEVWKPWNG